MGEFISAYCHHCHEQDDFMIGVGMMDYSLEQVLRNMRGKSKRIVTEILMNRYPHDADYEHQMLTCPTCETLHSRYYVKVSWGDGEVYETKFRCGKCRTPLIKPNKPMSQHRCRHCGKRTLEEGIAGVWD